MKTDTTLVLLLGFVTILCIYLVKVNMDMSDFTTLMLEDVKSIRSEVVDLGGFQ